MKKLLIWDGDDTLWKGTILEGDQVELFPGRFELCKELASRGVLQSIASHNSLADIQRVLHKFDLEPFFLVPQASLMVPKHEMIYEIVRQLKLAKTSDIVFVDDNPSNRELISFACPDIKVVDPVIIDSVVGWFFTKSSYTNEDRGRVASYKAEQERDKSSQSYKDDYTRFLMSCNIHAKIYRPEHDNMQRIIELITRSNQLSAVAETYTPEALKDAQEELWACDVWDRYGNYGLTAVMWVSEVKRIHIRLMVVSCRLQGKGIGSAMLGWLINKSKGKFIDAEMIITSYNEQMQNLYKWYGFDPYKNYKTIVFEKFVESRVDVPPWIVIEGGE